MKRKEIVGEISLGDYRKKAAMQKAQSGMGAMFGRSPEERAKELATFKKRERGLERVKARDEKARKAEIKRQQDSDIASLPELKAEYERMKEKYKSLGGSNWQYADREQNLTDREREARSMEGPMNNLWRRINAAEKAQKEGVSEGGEFGAYYYEKVAQEIFNKREDITSEDEVLNQAYKIVSNDQGQKSARYMFNYDEDFPSDVVSSYFWLQRNKGDKAESISEEIGYDEVSAKDASYILRKLEQGAEMSEILDDFPELGRMMDVIAHEHGLHPDDDFEEIENVLMNDLEDIASEEDDFGDYDPDEEMEEAAGTLKVAKDDEKQTILQNPTTGVQTQIDKTNPNAPRLTQDEQGKLKLAMPQGAQTGGAGPEKAPNLVGKDVQVDQMPEMLDIKRLAGL